MPLTNEQYAELVKQAEALGITNPQVMAGGELQRAIAKSQADTIAAGRQQFGNATQAQIQQAQGLGIQTHGMNAKSMQEAIDASLASQTTQP